MLLHSISGASHDAPRAEWKGMGGATTRALVATL
jgi:hypothetical protein